MDLNDFLASNTAGTPAFYIKPYQFVLVGLCLILVGSLVLYFFLPDLLNQIDKGKTFLTIDGTVVDHVFEASDGRYVYAEIVEYTVDGQTFHATSNMYSSNPKSVGSTLTLKYNPEDPKDVIFSLYRGFLVPVIIAGVLVLAGIFIFIYVLIRRPEKVPVYRGP